MANKKELAVILLDRNALYYYCDIFPSPIQCPFPQELVKDVEVLNKEQFAASIKVFIEANNLPPANIVILLAENILFEKDVSNPAENENSLPTGKNTTQLEEFRAKATKDFIDTVPFENIITHTYPLENGIKIVATNNDLPTIITEGFEQKGSIITAVVPSALLGEAIANGLNTQTTQFISSQMENIKQQSMIKVYQNIMEDMSDSTKPASAPKHNSVQKTQRLYALIGVFVILFSVMGFLLYQQSQDDAKLAARRKLLNTSPPVANTNQANTVSSFIPSPTIAVTASSLNPAVAQTAAVTSVKIQIITNTITLDQADALKKKLQDGGFANVSILNQNGSSGAKSLIIFSHIVDPITRNHITDVLKTITPDYSVQETTQSQFDAVIILSPGQ